MRELRRWPRFRRRVARAAGTLMVASVLGMAVLAPTGYVAISQTAQSEFCNSCHIMEPFFASWQRSPHAEVDCIECHYAPGSVETLAGKWQALSQLAKYATQTQGTKPWAEVSDASCLRSGCHALPELDGPLDYDGVRFDHRPHLFESRLGASLRCVTCHAQVVQTEHMSVAPETCFACHFMEGTHAAGAGGAEEDSCTLCHEPPQGSVLVAGAPFVHADFLARGVRCTECHTNVVEGDGTVREQRCRSCHGEPEHFERIDEPRYLHEVHVTRSKVECFECHDEIRHGLLEPALAHASAGGDCERCHAAPHGDAAAMYAGRGLSIEDGAASRMLATRVGCEACHTGSSSGESAAHAGIAAAGEVDCIRCHGLGVHGMLAGWQGAIGGALEKLGPLAEELAPRVGASNEARALLDAARGDLAAIAADGSRGAHNLRYALSALRSSAERIDRAGELAGATLASPAAAALPYVSQHGCSECHLGTELSSSIRVRGKPFSHELHLLRAGLDCAACHSVEQHGEPAFERSACGSCHHEESEQVDPTRCELCHPVQVGFLAGEVEGVEPTPSGMEDKECIDCHGEPPDLVRPKGTLCALCHDEEYAANLERWKAETGELHMRVEAALAAARRSGGSEAELAALRRRALDLVTRDGSNGAHNPELTRKLLLQALGQIERK